MVERSASYWKEFTSKGELQAVSVKRGVRVFKVGRGPHLVSIALKMVRAGLWEDVQVKHWKAKSWIDLADVPYREHSPAVRL